MASRGPHRGNYWRQARENGARGRQETPSQICLSPITNRLHRQWDSGHPCPKSFWSRLRKHRKTQSKRSEARVNHFNTDSLLAACQFHGEEFVIKSSPCWVESCMSVKGDLLSLGATFHLPVSSFISILIFRASAPQQQPEVWNSWLCCVFMHCACL